jgi:hypothetical protein
LNKCSLTLKWPRFVGKHINSTLTSNRDDGHCKLHAVCKELSKDGSVYEVAKECSDGIGIYDLGYVSSGDVRSEVA